MSTLLDLIQTKVNYVVQEAIVVIKDIFRKYPNKYVNNFTKLLPSDSVGVVTRVNHGSLVQISLWPLSVHWPNSFSISYCGWLQPSRVLGTERAFPAPELLHLELPEIDSGTSCMQS